MMGFSNLLDAPMENPWKISSWSFQDEAEEHIGKQSILDILGTFLSKQQMSRTWKNHWF